MSHQDLFLQTITDLSSEIQTYTIQAVDEFALVRLPEDPMVAFGPLGKINIFVGATNAGKSRFLRLLAKIHKPNFYSEEGYHAIFNFIASATWLADSREEFYFEIRQKIGRAMADRSPIVLQNAPKWGKEALTNVVPERDYKMTFDSNFFTFMSGFFINFLSSRISSNGRESNTIPTDIKEQLQIAKWTYSLLLGELNSREQREAAYNRQQYQEKIWVDSWKTGEYLLKFDIASVSEEWREHFVLLWKNFEYLSNTETLTIEEGPKRIYIPTLRSAVTLLDKNNRRLDFDVFAETVRKNYNLNYDNLDIFTGIGLYDTLKRSRNGTPEVVARLTDFERFLGNAFYEGRRVDIVALDEFFQKGQHISVRVQGEADRELHDLGDGINTLIVLLYQLFMAEPGSWIFIEEPELNLHPGLQRLFLQTILENDALQSRNLRIFFTTHSNHLLRMTLRDGTIASNDISVFAFQQRDTDKQRFLIRPLLSEHHHALALLGVQNASVLLAQCGIWVEGITDRQYIRAYLNAYQNSEEFKKSNHKTMREDTHFAFWEYAGSNLSHYLMAAIPDKRSAEAQEYERGQKDVFAQIQSSALCNRIFLIADRDNEKAKKHDALKALTKGRNNFVYYPTVCIEIENLLSPSEIMACLPQLFGKSAIAPTLFSQDDYKDVRIGQFLKERFPSYFTQDWVWTVPAF